MLRFKEATSELSSRVITSIEDFQSANSFFSKIDSILKTKDSLSIKAKRRSLDVKNKRSRTEFDDQSIRRLRSRFEHIEKKNLKTRRNDRNDRDDRDDRENKKSEKRRDERRGTDERASDKMLHTFSIE